jgi:methylase of polypeptide subunit release factors
MAQKKDPNISSATQRNWKRLGTQWIEWKLTKRANKRKSEKQIIPEEYISSSHKIIETIYAYQSRGFEIKEILFSLSINLTKWVKNTFLEKELNGWWVDEKRKIQELIDIELPKDSDLLWGIYQALMTEGEKNIKWSYYTPASIIKEILSVHFVDWLKVLDPCCWSGNFLLHIPSTDPSNLWGFDYDTIAVKIARINLIKKYNWVDFEPNILHLDTLKKEMKKYNNSFDLILTNPPWGSDVGTYSDYTITSWESFSLFIERGMELLRENGVLSYILPESILNVKVHHDIRKYLLDYNILSIHELWRIFNWVFTPVIRIDVKKNKEDWLIDIFSDTTHSIEKSEFLKNIQYTFTIHINWEDQQEFDAIFLVDSIYLNNENSDWALWVVTGNNSDFISDIQLEGYIPVFTWKEVQPYKLKPAKKYLRFEPEKFQQIAPLQKYTASPKLIYKFISDSLVFSLDNESSYTLNSANIIIPKVDYPIMTILALFNSRLFNKIFKKKFNSIKVLKSHIQSLPLPIISHELHREIETLIEKVLHWDMQAQSKIDTLIEQKIYNL